MKKRDKLVTLVKVPDEVQGSMIVAALEQSGIKATMTGVFTAGFRAEAPGDVSVVVSEKDMPVAKKILKSMDLDAPVDWSTVDVGKPEE